jgi:hypothetical protein
VVGIEVMVVADISSRTIGMVGRPTPVARARRWYTAFGGRKEKEKRVPASPLIKATWYAPKKKRRGTSRREKKRRGRKKERRRGRGKEKIVYFFFFP